MVKCSFKQIRNEIAACEVCGREVKYAGDVTRLRAACKACIYFGNPTGETVLVRCQTCKGNVRQKFAVHACAIFGKCLPTLTGDPPEGYAKCHGCERREVRKPP